MLLFLFWDLPWLERSAVSVEWLILSAVVRPVFWLRWLLLLLWLRRRLENWLGISEWILIFCLLRLLELLGLSNRWNFRGVEKRVLCFTSDKHWVGMVLSLVHLVLHSFWHLIALIDWVVLE